MNIYESLAQGMGDLPQEDTESNGVDAFLETPGTKTASNLPNSMTVSSLDDLIGFYRIGSDTLINKSEKDLWRITEKNGEVMIERLFDPQTNAALKV